MHSSAVVYFGLGGFSPLSIASSVNTLIASLRDMTGRYWARQLSIAATYSSDARSLIV